MTSYIILAILLFCTFIAVSDYSSNIEEYVGNLKVANEIDKQRAHKFALKTLCEKNGYKWSQGGDEFVYECKHTKDTCINESVYPTPKDGIHKYYEWRDKSDPEFKETLSGIISQQSTTKWDDDGVCIMGNENFRKFCEDENLRYDTTTGKCYTTKKYCRDKQLAFCNGDCFEPPVSKITSAIFGTTIGRALGSSSLLDIAVSAGCSGGDLEPGQLVNVISPISTNINTTLLPNLVKAST